MHMTIVNELNNEIPSSRIADYIRNDKYLSLYRFLSFSNLPFLFGFNLRCEHIQDLSEPTLFKT